MHWIIKLFDSDNNTQEIVLIDIKKEILYNCLSNDTPHVLLLKSILEYDDRKDQGGFQGDDDPQTSRDSNEPCTYTHYQHISSHSNSITCCDHR